MGQSTDGQLCYGIVLPEGIDLPWEDYSEDAWWREVNGFKPSKELYDENQPNGYVNGIKPSENEIVAYFDEQSEWEKANPMPVELVNYCSGECPMYMIAIPSSFKNNSRGFPLVINPDALKVSDAEERALIDFVNKYLGNAIVEYNGEEYNEEVSLVPQWYLSSYWG